MAAIETLRIATTALFVLGWSAALADTCQALKPDHYGVYHFEFPRDLAGIRQERTWTDDDPRIGANARYRGQGITLDIAIADYGVADLPDGIDSPALQKKFEELKASLKDSGEYDRVLLQSERRRSIGAGAIPIVEAVHTLEAGGTKTMSFIYLAARYREFINISLTLAASRWGDANQITDGILASVMGVFCQNTATVTQNGGSGTNLSVSASDRTRILAAIDRMLRVQSVAEAGREFQAVTTFAADAAGAVQIIVNETFFEMSGNDFADRFLMTFYVAGAVKHDLENPEAALDSRADITSSIRAMITGYNLYTIENAYFHHPFVEGFTMIDASGGLEDYVNSLQ